MKKIMMAALMTLGVVAAAGGAPSLATAAQGRAPAGGFTADITSLENILRDSKIAVSAGDPGAMRDISMRTFEGSIPGNTGVPTAAPAAVRAEVEKDTYSTAVAGPAEKSVKKEIVFTPKAAKPGLASKVPALAKEEKKEKETKGDFWDMSMKLLKYGAIAVAATLVVGGAIVGAVAFGVPGALIGLAAGAVVAGALAVKVIMDFWHNF